MQYNVFTSFVVHFYVALSKEKTNPPFLYTASFFPINFLPLSKRNGKLNKLKSSFLCADLQELDLKNNTPLGDTASITPSSIDMITTDVLASDPPLHSSPVWLNSCKSSSNKICSNMQFSFQELKKRREKRLSLLQSSKFGCGKAKVKRFLFLYPLFEIRKYF